MDFTKTFFAKHSLLKILFRYCVFTSDRLLLVMRPYQIVATERILNKLQIAHNYKQFGSVDAGGYVWHTTGSGKTLTSFKTAQLASQLPFIHRVLFVVDRKDLGYQTMKEYDKFQQGAANSNTSTKILTQQLSDPNAKIIITTIQKLAIFIKRQSSHQILNENMMLIFDECHRSQFLNSVKRFGNIVCFRNLEKATNESIALFGDKDAGGLVLMKSFQDYYEGYEENGKRQRGYKEMVAELLEKFPIGERIESEKAKKEFIKLYGAFLKLQNILSVFDQFKGFKENDAENINDDIVFEMELIKQVDINIDYILELIRQYQAKNGEDKTLLVTIEKAIDASVELRNKKALIQTFIHSLTPNTDIDESWRSHIEQAKQKELSDIIDDEHLNPEAIQQFVNTAFENSVFSEAGTLIDKVLPPMSRFTPDNQRSKKRQTVLGKLKAFFERFLGI